MLNDHIDVILLITGLATPGALSLSLAPMRMSKIIFGRPPADELGIAIARHWGLLVGSVGALIVYSAYHPETRVPVLIVAIAEKAAFAFGIFLSPFRRRPTALGAALADASMATLYLIYLTALWNSADRKILLRASRGELPAEPRHLPCRFSRSERP